MQKKHKIRFVPFIACLHRPTIENMTQECILWEINPQIAEAVSNSDDELWVW